MLSSYDQETNSHTHYSRCGSSTTPPNERNETAAATRSELRFAKLFPCLVRISMTDRHLPGRAATAHNRERTMSDGWIYRTKILGLILASLLSTLSTAQPGPNQAPNRTWITDVSIISPEKLNYIEKGSVLIENGRIVSVERRKRANKPVGNGSFGRRRVSYSRPNRLARPSCFYSRDEV